MIEFSTPILSVSPEVVKDLDGEDALYGMWTGTLNIYGPWINERSRLP